MFRLLPCVSSLNAWRDKHLTQDKSSSGAAEGSKPKFTSEDHAQDKRLL